MESHRAYAGYRPKVNRTSASTREYQNPRPPVVFAPNNPAEHCGRRIAWRPTCESWLEARDRNHLPWRAKHGCFARSVQGRIHSDPKGDYELWPPSARRSSSVPLDGTRPLQPQQHPRRPENKMQHPPGHWLGRLRRRVQNHRPHGEPPSPRHRHHQLTAFLPHLLRSLSV